MALSQTAYSRGAHVVHAADNERSMPPWEDRLSSQFGLQVSVPESAPALEPEAPQALASPTPHLRGTAAELRSRMGTAVPVARRPHLRGTAARGRTAEIYDSSTPRSPKSTSAPERALNKTWPTDYRARQQEPPAAHEFPRGLVYH